MNHGIYIAASGMKSRMQALDVSSNNVANASTIGFKKDRTFFNIFNRVDGSPLEKALADSMVAERTEIDFSIGPLIRTDNTLHLALEEEGFFVVETPQGERFTRNGEFQINSRREVVTAGGFRVLGQDGPIVIPEGVTIDVSPSGQISVDSIPAGNLRITHFENLKDLRKAGAVNFEATPGAVQRPPLRMSVKQGFLEGSNVNPVAGLADSIKLGRSFEMLARAMRTLSEGINRKVIDEVGRV